MRTRKARKESSLFGLAMRSRTLWAIVRQPSFAMIMTSPTVATSKARILVTDLRRDGLLLRTWKDGQAKLNGYLEDYGSLVDGLISLYEATGELEWIESATLLANRMIEQFWDDEAGGFFFTGQMHE